MTPPPRRMLALAAAVPLLALPGCVGDDDDDTTEAPVVRLEGEHRLDDIGTLLAGEGSGRAGAALAVADFDGDGFDDLVMGAPELADGAGGVLIWRGQATGPTLAATLEGIDPGDHAGASVAAVGDVDGDGLPDLLVGAPGAGLSDDGDEDTATGLAQGAAFVVAGPLSPGASLGGARAVLRGEETTDCAGYSVASAGDVDGDGIDDLLVGAPCRGSYREFHEHVQAFMLFDGPGSAYLVLGDTTGDVSLADSAARYDGVELWDRFGRSVVSAGDHDGDGRSDVAVGAPDYYGAIWINPEAEATVFVLPGTERGVVSAEAVALATVAGGCCGAEAHDELGAALTTAGDGFVAGAPALEGFEIQGGAFVLPAPLAGGLDPWSAGSVVVGPVQPNMSARAGTSVAAGFDFDCDGQDDVALGAPEEQELGPRSGAVRLGYGPAGAYVDLGVEGLHGIGANSEEAGRALAAGDLDGDGCDELIVGAPAHRTDGEEAGGAWWIPPPRE